MILRESTRDREFHFQNWFEARLGETGPNYERGGRKTTVVANGVKTGDA